MNLSEMLEQNNIKHFTEAEIINGKTIPVELYPNIIPTIRVLDKLREEINLPIHINSTYRDVQYNVLVGGKSNSLHLYFNAIDFCARTSMYKIYEILDNWDSTHKFHFLPKPRCMGIGMYERQYFIHLDTRGILNRQAARW